MKTDWTMHVFVSVSSARVIGIKESSESSVGWTATYFAWKKQNIARSAFFCLEAGKAGLQTHVHKHTPLHMHACTHAHTQHIPSHTHRFTGSGYSTYTATAHIQFQHIQLHTHTHRFTGSGYLCLDWVSLMPEDAWDHHKQEAEADSSSARGYEETGNPVRFSDKPYPWNRNLVSSHDLHACACGA